MVTTLPIRDGGLGIYSMSDTIQYCYLASCIQSKQLQDSILRHSGVCSNSLNYQLALDSFLTVCHIDSASFNIELTGPHPMHLLAAKYFDVVQQEMSNLYNMSVRDLVLWNCNKFPHAQDYLFSRAYKWSWTVHWSSAILCCS